MILAIKIVLPTTQVKGCYSHFIQAIIKNVDVKLNLKYEFTNDMGVKEIIHKSFALASIKGKYVMKAFSLITKEVDGYSNCHTKVKLKCWIDYMEHTWIGSEKNFHYSLVIFGITIKYSKTEPTTRLKHFI